MVGIAAPCNACEVTTEYAAAIATFMPDGSDLHVDAGGIRAATGLVYYPGTDLLFVTMNQRDDLGDVTPGDWLAVVSEGQSWGFPDCYGQDSIDCETQPEPVAVASEGASWGRIKTQFFDAGKA